MKWLVKSKNKWGQVVVSSVEGYLVATCIGVLQGILIGFKDGSSSMPLV